MPSLAVAFRDMGKSISRTPPTAVRRALRQEVAFGCPVSACGNPYLEYHHFDPPWEVEQHHDPTRMIALCATHHAKANAWTVEQLRDMKRVASDRPDVEGRFEWLRDNVLAVVGGNFYYETLNMVVFREEPLIWLQRDEEGRLRLNFRMLTAQAEEPRAEMRNNDWIVLGDPADVESPPNGSRLRVRYPNGDDVGVRFREWADASSLGTTYPDAARNAEAMEFPLVTAEVTMVVGGTDVRFGPTSTQLGGIQMTGCFASHCGAGLAFG